MERSDESLLASRRRSWSWWYTVASVIVTKVVVCASSIKAASKDHSLEATIRVAGINYRSKFLKLKTLFVKKYF
jgi:hypothetical protein